MTFSICPKKDRFYWFEKVRHTEKGKTFTERKNIGEKFFNIEER